MNSITILTEVSGSANASIRAKHEWTGISCDITDNAGNNVISVKDYHVDFRKHISAILHINQH